MGTSAVCWAGRRKAQHSVESITREREGRGSRDYPPSILATSSTSLPSLPTEQHKRNTRQGQDVYSKSQPSCWIFVCHQPGKVIHQTTSLSSFSFVKTNRLQQSDPAPETVCYHEMYFWPWWTLTEISFSRSSGSHLSCPHLFLHCLRFHGDRSDEQHPWTPTPAPPQHRKMTKTRCLTWRMKLLLYILSLLRHYSIH